MDLLRASVLFPDGDGDIFIIGYALHCKMCKMYKLAKDKI